MNLILGTAKMGMPDYGFSSGAKKSHPQELLQEAWSIGIRELDTSPRYGNAEKLIGVFHDRSSIKFKVSTKIDGLDPSHNNLKEKIFSSIDQSLRAMRLTEIEVLYLHQNSMEIISNPKVLSVLSEVKEKFPVNKIGVSIYSYDECKFATQHDIYDVVQVPISVMDSNIYSRLDKFSRNRTEIIARSIFLQGLLINRSLIPSRVKQFSPLLNYLSEIDGLAERYGMSLVEIACAYVARLGGVASVIVGSNSVENLTALYGYSQMKISDELFSAIFCMARTYKNWGNPRNW